MERFDGWDTELCHHGIKGQKWGIRRFQNPDGTLTEAGKKRYLNEGDDGLSKSGQKRLVREYAWLQKHYPKNPKHYRKYNEERNKLNSIVKDQVTSDPRYTKAYNEFEAKIQKATGFQREKQFDEARAVSFEASKTFDRKAELIVKDILGKSGNKLLYKTAAARDRAKRIYDIDSEMYKVIYNEVRPYIKNPEIFKLR